MESVITFEHVFLIQRLWINFLLNCKIYTFKSAGQAVRSGPKSKPSNTLASSSLKSSLDEGKQNLHFICLYIAGIKTV